MTFRNAWLVNCPYCRSESVEIDRRSPQPPGVNGFAQLCLRCGKRFIFTIDGVGSTPTKEVKMSEEKPKVAEGFDVTVDELRERVARGNDKLMEAWPEICDLPEPEHSAEIHNWAMADEKLSRLCEVLKLRGYTDCLYIVGGKKTRSCSITDRICLVCPSKRSYWTEEMLAKFAPRQDKKGEETMRFLKTLGGKI